jgi:hypothetical protein
LIRLRINHEQNLVAYAVTQVKRWIKTSCKAFKKPKFHFEINEQTQVCKRIWIITNSMAIKKTIILIDQSTWSSIFFFWLTNYEKHSKTFTQHRIRSSRESQIRSQHTSNEINPPIDRTRWITIRNRCAEKEADLSEFCFPWILLAQWQWRRAVLVAPSSKIQYCQNIKWTIYQEPWKWSRTLNGKCYNRM